ncbi:hydrogenase [Lysobacter solisilvae]|uniref:Hydrogenase n=2 Tax=Agrilutibacter solisilvae TaxID=2763317 RepID=A0A974Y208_9GAMM|nr:hydrogenase [Lysobacter solisilvae]
MFAFPRHSTHRQADDLLTGGLGLDGLRAAAPPAFADPVAPTAAELRRRALWSNWRGIADLAPAGGYGTLYGGMPSVPGREFHALATVPGARHPHRVMVQVPDAFDAARRCVVVTASSGSRGIYGAIAVAGAWGLPRGCAVAYTDKGAGTDYFDLDAGMGTGSDGTVVGPGQAAAFNPLGNASATNPAPAAGSERAGHGVAFKHAHSGDNPEADWGAHVKQAAQFALAQLDEAYPQAAPFTFDNTRVIAVGISNGGGAVLRAAEQGDWLDAVVAGEPNVSVDGVRPLYDIGTEAGLLMPCAVLAVEDRPRSPLSALAQKGGELRCASLAAAGILAGGDVAAQARQAHAQLRASGWTDAAIRAGTLSVDFDLWRAIAATYASSYGRFGVGEHPCGYAWSALNPDFTARAATASERAAWWADGSGIPPGAGIGLVDTKAALPDPTLPGLQCLRALWTGEDAQARRVHAGIAQTRAGLPRAGLPVLVIHGRDDGLLPPAFTSDPYVARAQAAGRDVHYWQVANAQHFDGFLALPDYRARYVPLLPYVYAALDAVMAHLDDPARPLPADALVPARASGPEPLTAAHLAVPR